MSLEIQHSVHSGAAAGKRPFYAVRSGGNKIASGRDSSRDRCSASMGKLMKKREAIKQAIQAWAASSNPETVSHLGSDDAKANELRSELSKKILASIKARKKKGVSD
jgi:hypothetical protein